MGEKYSYKFTKLYVNIIEKTNNDKSLSEYEYTQTDSYFILYLL